MTILCAVQDLFLSKLCYLNFKLRIQTLFKFVPRYVAIRAGLLQFSELEIQ